jgi:hypothetical protein
MRDYHITISSSDDDEGYIADLPVLRHALHSVILFTKH